MNELLDFFVQGRHWVRFQRIRSAVWETLSTVHLVPHHPQRILRETAQTWQEDYVNLKAKPKGIPHILPQFVSLFAETISVMSANIAFIKVFLRSSYSYLQKFAGEQVISNREESWMPLIFYRASLMGTAEGEDATSFISSDTNKQPSLTNRSRSPSIKQVNSEGKTPRRSSFIVMQCVKR